MSDSALRIVLVLPEVLGTYGDSGNAAVLAARARWRGVDAEVVVADRTAPVPTGGDLYVLGGGEDAAQLLATAHLAASPGLAAALGRVPVLAVCAGLQVLGASFTTAEGAHADGLGLLDLVTTPGPGSRRVGEVVATPLVEGLPGALVGFENHGGVTTLGPGVRPLARVRDGAGIGNGTGDGAEGAVAGMIVGTYLHGPVLARNAALADLLLSWAIGAPLPPLHPPSGMPVTTVRSLTAPNEASN